MRARSVTAATAAAFMALTVAAVPAQAGPTVDYPTMPTSKAVSVATGKTMRVFTVETGAGYTYVGRKRIPYARSEALYGLRNASGGRVAVSAVRGDAAAIDLWLKNDSKVIGTVNSNAGQVLLLSPTRKVVSGPASLPGAEDGDPKVWAVDDMRTVGKDLLVVGTCAVIGQTAPEGEELRDLSDCAARVAIAAIQAQS